jgi:Ca2+-transporting ATPase
VVMMESYLNENFGEVKPKHSSEEVLQRWRNLCSVVKNPKRRFRFTANLSKRYEAAAMRRTNQVSRFSFFLFNLLHRKHPF